MTKQDPWFFEVRAAAFASLVLTKHDNVKILPYAGRDTVIDLLVEVLKGRKLTLRFFGVQIVPYMDLPDIREANGRVLSHADRVPKEAALPLCAFVIGVRKPEGLYRWTVEPVVEGGRALLRRDVEAD